MKKTALAKSDAKKLMGKMSGPGAATIGAAGAAAVVVDRREQRKLDQALGLVPFAVKLNADLVQQLQALAKARELDLNALVAEVLQKGLAG
ncbi:MAG: hypothetical protein H7Z39_10370 [Burkholderiaceae bacterium]|nr:hypothetical protein [Burkholderiaceae bacterium]